MEVADIREKGMRRCSQTAGAWQPQLRCLDLDLDHAAAAPSLLRSSPAAGTADAEGSADAAPAGPYRPAARNLHLLLLLILHLRCCSSSCSSSHRSHGPHGPSRRWGQHHISGVQCAGGRKGSLPPMYVIMVPGVGGVGSSLAFIWRVRCTSITV